LSKNHQRLVKIIFLNFQAFNTYLYCSWEFDSEMKDLEHLLENASPEEEIVIEELWNEK